MFRSWRLIVLIAALAGCLVAAGVALARNDARHRHEPSRSPRGRADGERAARTPIKHLVVVYQENVSFDHYFGTYPRAANPADEPAFGAARGTPTVNGLTRSLREQNPNAANPQRLDRSEPLTCDQDHDYTAEQKAFDHGLMDRFVENTNREGCPAPDKSRDGLVMDYYDGNTVTGLWNYAQRFAMSDNSYGTTFGPSTPGALNLISGQTGGASPATVPGEAAGGTVIGDPDPTYDDCSSGTTVGLSGRNIGDLLDAKGVSWGWFQGGFRPTSHTRGKSLCAASHRNVGGASVGDYSAHHEPFQYYRSTANPGHVAPASPAEIGHAGTANHQYDLADFWTSARRGSLPAVSFLKAAKYQDGHAGYSGPLDEQHFLIQTINRLQRLPEWRSTAVIIAYDDSDGWYDHQMSPILNDSQSGQDTLTGEGQCGAKPPAGGYQDRCGYGPRLPLLAISPYARRNFVDHSITDQSSILRFVEDNWGTGRIGNASFDSKAGSLHGLLDLAQRPQGEKLILDPSTGQPVARRPRRRRR